MTTITNLLTPKSGADPRDRERLLSHVLKKPREWVIAHPEAPVRPSQVARYRRLLHRLSRGEPLPYLLREQWFYGRPFIVNRNVLVPRPETELLIELAIARAQKYRMQNTECRIIDVGTGSGCIAVTLAAELPQVHIIATDTSPAALHVARTNARRHGVVDRVMFLRGNLLEQILSNLPTPSSSPSRREGEKRKKVPQFCILPSAFCIVANLPYLTTAEWRALPHSLRAYEPRQALDGDPDGLKYYRELFAQLVGLTPYALRLTALLEIDPRRKRALANLIRKTLPGWRASWHRDLAGRWRILELHGPTV